MDMSELAIEDFDEILGVEEFSSDAVFKVLSTDPDSPLGTYPDPQKIRVIYVNEFDAATQSFSPAESAKPFVIAATKDVPGVTHQSTIAVAGFLYNVIRVEPGTGPSTKLVLSRNPQQ
jgi:hypothetical protein